MRSLNASYAGQRFLAQQASTPSPIGGLNTRDALSSMPATDAVIMDNAFPDLSGVFSRKGKNTVVLGEYGTFSTLVEYSSGAIRQLISMADGKIYKGVTTASLTEIANSYTSDEWNCINMGGYLLGFNGEDTPFKYDGTTVTDNVFTGSGLTPADLFGAAVYKNRLFVWKKDDSNFWYGAIDAISGALTEFPLSRLNKFGGNVVSIENWSIDANNGPNAFLVIFFSSGDIVLYEGDDPSDAANWQLVGSFRSPPLINARSVAEVAGDLFFVTAQDVLSLKELYQNGGIVPSFSKLSGAIVAAFERYKNNFGWEVVFFQNGRKLLINVPVGGGQSVQYVVNVSTGAPCRFTNWDAVCMGVFNDNLYYGNDGVIVQADIGFSDDGAPINASIKTAYSNFGQPLDKAIKAVRPIWNVSGSSGVQGFSIGFDFDYKNQGVVQPVNPTVSSFTAWHSPWHSPWSSEGQMQSNTYLANGHGVDISFIVRLSLLGQQFSWYRNDYQFQVNSFII